MGYNPNSAKTAERPPQIPPDDTDFDGLATATENLIGSNPAVVDTDGDGIPDGLELRGYTTSPTLTNTDGDLCPDFREIVSVNVDNVVNSFDLGILASVFARVDRPVQDVNKNGVVNSSDLLLVSLFFNSNPC
jgi:hypothetical protein